MVSLSVNPLTVQPDYPPVAVPAEQLVSERVRLRRLAAALAEVISPGEPYATPGLVGVYRAVTAPANVVPLLDYVEQLLRERREAHERYVGQVQELLREWREDCQGEAGAAFFDLKCRELTGRLVDEPAPGKPG